MDIGAVTDVTRPSAVRQESIQSFLRQEPCFIYEPKRASKPETEAVEGLAWSDKMS
jgi:hypothetical protein